MTYRTARNRSIRDALGRRIEDFARRYRPGEPTIVLLPGGMGSQLDRSVRRYRSDGDLPFERYNPIWMDLGVLFAGDTLKLAMQAGRDLANHIVIPDGPLDFLVNAYDGTERFFLCERGWNYICFGFDWRRPVTEWAGFLETFLKRLGQRVKQLRGESPLPNTTLLCHSMGGLVATAFLQRLASRSSFRPADIGQWLSSVVTVGTPYYGTATHMRRYYKGQGPLNRLHSATRIARIAGTLPGPYINHPLDRTTYQRDAVGLGKSAFPLTRYPMREAGDDKLEIDPFEPAAASRYPNWVSRAYLKQARQIRQMITRRLPAAMSRRVFHLRSGRTQMSIEQKWRNVDGASFDPERDAHPVLQSHEGPGDGTVPTWSARLVDTPLDHVYDFKHARKHVELTEHRETLGVVSALVEQGRLPVSIRTRDEDLGLRKASIRRMNTLIDDAVAGRIARDDSLSSDQAVWRRLVEEASLC